MHTFFINTSKRKFDTYDVLFDVYYASYQLISKQCLIENWYDKERGYRPLADSICRMIDSYDELNDAYQMIVFFDISSVKEYAELSHTMEDQQRRDICAEALAMLYTHTLQNTLLGQLQRAGKAPHETLILFGETRRLYEHVEEQIDYVKREIQRYLFTFLGIPDDNTLIKICKELPSGESQNAVDAFLKRINEAAKDAPFHEMAEAYTKEINLWAVELLRMQQLEKAHKIFYDKVEKQYQSSGIQHISCTLNSEEGATNKSAASLSTLNFVYYLLTCVNEQSVCAEEKHTPRPYVMHSAEELSRLLMKKRALFVSMNALLMTTVGSFNDLGLTPPLYELDYRRFMLEDTGSNNTVFEEIDGEQQETPEETEQDKNNPPVQGIRRVLRLVDQGKRKNLLLNNQYKPFLEKENTTYAVKTPKAFLPKQLIEQAKNVRRHHISFLHRVKQHTDDILSHYAGKSLDNLHPLLRKRIVSDAEFAQDEIDKVEYQYRNPEGRKDKRPLNAIQTSSKKAYQTAVTNFLSFCAGRSVAVTDVEKQCNWFITRVRRIESTLSWLRHIAIGLGIAVLLAYVPFVVIQWETIWINPSAALIASASIGIPLIALSLVYTLVSILYRRKYREAWESFLKQSDQVLAENREAVQKYDELLYNVIPSLRWIYEYNMDVAFYTEFCKLATAKLHYHISKLRERIDAIDKMINDMEIEYRRTEEYPEVKTSMSMLNYQASFCSDDKNLRFYTILPDILNGNEE